VDEYNDAPFHSFKHAWDVLHFAAMIVSHIRPRLSDEDVTALLLGALLHDVAHPGVTSVFLEITKAPLTTTFDPAHGGLLEQMHAARAADLLGMLSFPAEWDVGSKIRELILATDMSQHSSTVHAIQRILDELEARMAASCQAENETAIESLFAHNKSLLLKFLLKLSDLSNLVKSRPLAWQWTACLHTEFQQQLAIETELGISTGLIKHDTSPATMVLNFMRFVLPAWETFARLSPLGRSMLNQFESNRSFWTAVATKAHVNQLAVLTSPKLCSPSSHQLLRRNSCPQQCQVSF
jgi:hypothetical protein